MKADQINVLILEPKQPAKVETITNDLSVLQKIVGGYIEVIGMQDYDIIINEEGKLLELEPNFMLHNGYDFVAGTAILVGVDYEEGEFVSLTDEQILKLQVKLSREGRYNIV